MYITHLKTDIRKVKWGKTSTLRMRAHILLTNWWSSLKLLHDQTHVKFLIHRYFCREIYTTEIKRLHKFHTKGAKQPSFGAKRPPRYIGSSSGERAHDAITSFSRRHDTKTSFWRNNGFIIASCARWDHSDKSQAELSLIMTLISFGDY